LIDVVILVVIYGIFAIIFISVGFPGPIGLAGVLSVVTDVAYFAYFWSSRGASIGMMPFGFKVRCGAATRDQIPAEVGEAAREDVDPIRTP